MVTDPQEDAIREAAGAWYEAAFEYTNWVQVVAQARARPFMLLQPKMFRHASRWCALYGEDLASGVFGMGDTPAEAAAAFDVAWSGTADVVEALWISSDVGVWWLWAGNHAEEQRMGWACSDGRWVIYRSATRIWERSLTGGRTRLLEAAKASKDWACVTKWPEVNGD